MQDYYHQSANNKFKITIVKTYASPSDYGDEQAEKIYIELHDVIDKVDKNEMVIL